MNLISRLLHNVLTNFLILRCVIMEIQTIVLTSNTLRGIGGEGIVKNFLTTFLITLEGNEFFLNGLVRLFMSR